MSSTPSEKAIHMAIKFESRGDIEKAEYWMNKAASLEKKYGSQEIVKAFMGTETTLAGDATEILFNQALPSVPIWRKERIDNEYQGFVRAWGSMGLIEGSSEDLKERVLTNLKRSVAMPSFRYFTIQLCENMGLAQVVTWSDGGGISVCLWRSKESLYLCGNSQFV